MHPVRFVPWLVRTKFHIHIHIQRAEAIFLGHYLVKRMSWRSWMCRLKAAVITTCTIYRAVKYFQLIFGNRFVRRFIPVYPRSTTRTVMQHCFSCVIFAPHFGFRVLQYKCLPLPNLILYSLRSIHFFLCERSFTHSLTRSETRSLSFPLFSVNFSFWMPLIC